MRVMPPAQSLFTRVAAACALPLIIASLLLILFATLYPFTFQGDRIGGGDDLLQALQRFFFRTSGSYDRLINILLFVPLGFGLASAPALRRVRGWWLLAGLACAGLSLGVEGLQLLLPSRRPTAVDVFTNTSGAALGMAAFLLARRLCSTRRRFAVVAAVAAVGLLALTSLMQASAPFRVGYFLRRYEWAPLAYLLLRSSLVFGLVGLALALSARPAWGVARRAAAALGGSLLAALASAGLAALAGGRWPGPGLLALQVGVALAAWAVFQALIASVNPGGAPD